MFQILIFLLKEIMLSQAREMKLKELNSNLINLLIIFKIIQTKNRKIFYITKLINKSNH